ncbi:MAG: DUF488 domain-containing protein [Planctomycetota bacterium]|nr:DUF488 domain-containing protein [Planctomycetota bacterium]MDI6786771.1 DUF488 domain-containing protein [Planctomycetota bacterium]
MPTSTLFTIGYAGKEINDFINLLHQSEITTLIDIRQLPISRKHDFSKSRLQVHLEQAGIEYEHIGILGSPKTIRDKVYQDNDYETFFTEYTKYTKTKQDVVEEVVDTVTRKISCLMCVEPTSDLCHRRIVAETIEKQAPKLKVVHL